MPTIAIRGCDLAHELAGAPGGIPMVWGHGLTSSRAAEDRFPLVDSAVLRLDRPVLRYDARGHGDSGDLADPAAGDWRLLALDQVALLDELGIDDVVVGGASMGAATALHAAPLLAGRLRALVLVIPPTAWETRAAQTTIYASTADIIERRGVEPLIAASAGLPPPDPFVEVAGEHRARRAETLRATDPRRLAQVYRGALGADLPPVDAIASIGVPTLVLAWSGDPGHPVSTAERLCELIPDSELVVASTLVELATWTERVRRFLAERPADARSPRG